MPMAPVLPAVEQRLRADLGRPLHSGVRRLGVMLHYDASVSDAGALAWLTDPRCRVGYNYLVLDNARIVELIPADRRAPHAGRTRSSDPVRLPYPDDCANSAFYGVAIAAGGRAGDRATAAQVSACAALCRALFAHEGWPVTDTWRITSHHLEAWPRGRKVDIVGPDPATPVMQLDDVRGLLTLFQEAA
jgi:N-acetyl-anhydromuramyl-L-alanine amidase AmpD